MIKLTEIANMIERLEPNHLSLADFEEVSIFDGFGFRTGSFEEYSNEKLQLNWGLIWIDCHVPRVEIHELNSRKAIENYLIKDRCPFTSLSCGGFFVIHEDKVQNLELICETIDGGRYFETDVGKSVIEHSKVRRVEIRWK